MSSKQTSTPKKGKRSYWRKRPQDTPVTHKQLRGYKYSPSASIPETTPRPWYTLVVSYTAAPQEVDAVVFYHALIKQLDPEHVFIRDPDVSSPPQVTIKFISIEVWNLTGRAVSLSVWELPEDTAANQPGTSVDQLGGWTDAGGVDTFPRIGYKYPLAFAAQSHQLNPYNDNGFKICTTTASSDKDTLVHRFHIQWRVPGAVTYTVTLPRSPSTEALVTASRKSAHAVASQMVKSRGVLDAQLSALQKILAKIPVEYSAEFSELVASFERVECCDAP